MAQSDTNDPLMRAAVKLPNQTSDWSWLIDTTDVTTPPEVIAGRGDFMALIRGNLTLVTASSGVGKSSSLASLMKSGYRGVWLDTEQPPRGRMHIKRRLAHALGVDTTPEGLTERLREAGVLFLTLKNHRPEGSEGLDILELLPTIASEWKTDWLVLDNFPDIMNDIGDENEALGRVNYLSRELVAGLNIGVAVVVHHNKAGGTKGHAGSVMEQKADIVMQCAREGVNRVRCYFSKHREDAHPELTYSIDGEFPQWETTEGGRPIHLRPEYWADIAQKLGKTSWKTSEYQTISGVEKSRAAVCLKDAVNGGLLTISEGKGSRPSVYSIPQLEYAPD